MGATTRWFKSLIGIRKSNSSSSSSSVADQQDCHKISKSKSKRWVLWKASNQGQKNSSNDDSNNIMERQHSYYYDYDERKNSMSARYINVHPDHIDHYDQVLDNNTTMMMTTMMSTRYMYQYRSNAHWAATRIQSVFRGFLARRARRALKAIVRIQAIFRGRQVRRLLYNVDILCRPGLSQLRVHEPKKKDWNHDENEGSVGDMEAEWRRSNRIHVGAVPRRRERATVHSEYKPRTSEGPEFWQLWRRWSGEQELMEDQDLEKNKWNEEYFSGPISHTPRSIHVCSNEHRVGSPKQVFALHDARGSKSRQQSPTKLPGYMEATISMRAKCRSVEKQQQSQQSITPRSIRRKRHSSTTCNDNHHHILLQCN